MSNKVSRFILVLVLCLSLSALVFAGTTGKISGKAMDAVSKEPLFGVNIMLQGTTLGAATDASGDFFIINIPPGNYTLAASMMGYEKVNQTGVLVSVDHTTTTNFSLKTTTLQGQEVTIIAVRDIVPMDISNSTIVANASQVKQVPMVKNVLEYVNLQAGVENNMVRGGALDQTQFMMDGLMIVDNRINKPLVPVNLSSVAEVNIIQGGFNAEYGNVRSGLVNIITKEGSAEKYNGAIDFRITPGMLKHSGASVYSPENFYLRPYLDPGVMWVGTKNGTWSKEYQAQNLSFIGWNAYSKNLLSDATTTNDRTPLQAMEYFMWQHMTEGCDTLTGGSREPGSYFNKPDWNVDGSFGGPVPFIGKYLGHLTFFASHRQNREMWPLPTNKKYYTEKNSILKFISHLSSNMKLKLEGSYGEISTVTNGSDPNYFYSAAEMLASGSSFAATTTVGENHLYFLSSRSPANIYQAMIGLAFDHVLSTRTFYNVRLTSTQVKDYVSGPDKMRDMTVLRYFGKTPVTEEPLGLRYQEGKLTMDDGMVYAYGAAQNHDWSQVRTLNLQFDITSQVDKYNQLKAGFLVNYDDINNKVYNVRLDFLGGIAYNYWNHFPIRGGAYIQDKLEFQGMIANVGVRFDYNDPNSNWYTADRYSPYFTRKYIKTYDQVLPKEAAKGHLKISPRIGISHPISEHAKLYFNYGHFYSMPPSADMYRIQTNLSQGIYWLGNPNALMPKTVAYELGVDFNIANQFLVHLAGYYKDVADQTGTVGYTSYDGSVNYSTVDNNNYADIRGFELRIDKRWGRWITAWLNYNYMVTTTGYVGYRQYYEDPRMQLNYGIYNPYQEIPLPRPVFRGNLVLSTPEDFGPRFLGIQPLGEWEFSNLFQWKSGEYATYDPLNTYTLKDNVHWRSRYQLDTRVSKVFNFKGYRFTFFLDIKNTLDTKYLSSYSFYDANDQLLYFKSLHLPMYKNPMYTNAGYVGGDDAPGDVLCKDKQYIDMPNRDFMWYLNPRTFWGGFRVDF